jgi:hypothetical protein
VTDRLGARRHLVTGMLAFGLAAAIVAGLRCPPARHGAAATPGAYPLFDAWAARRIDSPIMRVLAAPGGPLLEVPTAPGPILHADAMHRAAIHGRPLLNGLDSYWPRDFPRRMELACRLPDPDALDALVHETGLDAILVHLEPNPFGHPIGPYACPPRPMGATPTPDERPFDPAPWESIARAGRDDLELVVRDGSDLLFRVRR